MIVKSVNIGEKKTINYEGKIVETGIFKYPIEKPIDKKSSSKLCFGFAISFPSNSKTKSDENSVSYIVNNVYSDQEYASQN